MSALDAVAPIIGIVVAVVAAGAPAHAAPWRIETALPPAPASGATAIEDEPVGATGVLHPSGRLGDFRLGVMGDAFITLQLRHRQGEWSNDIELSRVQLGGWLTWKQLAGINVTLESIRSTGNRSLLGIDGNSLLPRFKYAFVEVTPLAHWLSVRAGLIPDLLVPTVEASWDFRVQGPTGVERDGMFNPADLGAALEASLPWGLGSVAVAYGNGEGLNYPEQNNGKDITAALRIAPLRHRAPGLLIQLLYRDGSIGNGSAGNSRIAGGLTYAGRHLGAGAIGSYALGYASHGDWTAAHASTWVRGELPYRFFLFVRGDVLWPAVEDTGSLLGRAIVGVAWALPAVARLVLSYESVLPRGTLRLMVPATEEQRLLIQVEGRL